MSTTRRIELIDLARGLVIVLMALDHTRDFFGPALTSPTDIESTTPAWFFTRWITHLCAPMFVYLAGVSARLYWEKTQDSGQLTKFLFVRGLWLLAIEIVIVNFSWKLNYTEFMFVQVIWLLGLAMIWLAITHRLPRVVQWIIGAALILGHGLLYPYDGVLLESMPALWAVLHVQSWVPMGENFGVVVVYPLIPWIGLISIGFLTSDLFKDTNTRRDPHLYTLGGSLLLAFVLLRVLNGYGDPDAWQSSDRGVVYTFLSFMSVEKYPPSLDFLLATMGVSFVGLPLLDKLKTLPRKIILVFGSVPLFFYLIHVPIIHALAKLRNFLQFGADVQIYAKKTWPVDYEPNLIVVYLAWVVVLILSYYLSRWYFRYKSSHIHWWLKYL